MVINDAGSSRLRPQRNGVLRIIKSLVPSRVKSLLWNSSTEWLLVNNLLAVFPSHRVRIFVLRWLGATMGQDLAIYGGCEFRNPSALQIAAGSSIGHRCVIDARKGLRIGKSVTLGTEVMIWTLQHDYNDSKFGVKGGAVVVEDFAWLGPRSILLPGVKVGKGAVVAAGAVVTKDVDPFTVVGGIPAKLISKRTVQDLNYVPGSDRLHMV